jgi:hypothetical protein
MPAIEAVRWTACGEIDKIRARGTQGSDVGPKRIDLPSTRAPIDGNHVAGEAVLGVIAFCRTVPSLPGTWQGNCPEPCDPRDTEPQEHARRHAQARKAARSGFWSALTW